jgi:hypothetical protein
MYLTFGSHSPDSLENGYHIPTSEYTKKFKKIYNSTTEQVDFT